MHLGNARTALLSFLQVRAAGGAFLVRVEDLDRTRSRSEHTRTLFEDLAWLGVGSDEPPLYQSERQALYDSALARLEADGRVYPCFCTRAEVARSASAPHGMSDEGPRYPGTCAELTRAQVSERERTRTPAWRFRTQAGAVVSFVDRLHGPFAQDVHAVVGDFVVRRNDGVASYQLAVVVDDAASRISEVLRGDDLLSSTPRQLLLYEALGQVPPRFTHVPLVMGEDGKRLAKREGAFALHDLREAGVPVERVLGVLARWSGLGTGEPVTTAELVSRFALERLPRAPVIALEGVLRRLLGV